MPNIIFNIRDNTITEETKTYIISKISKLERLLTNAVVITVNVVEIKTHLSQFKDIDLEVLIKLPNAFVKVENKGHNINTLIDKLIPILQRRLKRYQSHEKKWENKAVWTNREIEKSMIVGEDKQDYLYEPQVKKKFLEDNTPMHAAEAIQRMELLGHKSFLFKNIESNTYGMIYKRDKGGYGLVIPKI